MSRKEPIMRLLRQFYNEFSLVVDDEGLPVCDYGRRLIRLGRHRNPAILGIVGLKAMHSASLVGLPEFDTTGDEILPHVSVEKMVEWLSNSSIDRGEYMVYHFNIPLLTYLLKPPWRSCLAEAFAGMFLIVYGTTKEDARCVDCGLKHLKSMLVPASKGGVRLDDSAVFLEYVGYEMNRRWPIVLNGHLYCLIALFNAWRMLGVPEFGTAFEQAVSELGSLLPVFEGPFFTYYDDYGNPATPFYHKIHVHQLERLYELTKLPYLHATANRWRKSSQRYNFTLALLMRACTMRIPYLPRR
jgi:hypothetical protein